MTSESTPPIIAQRFKAYRKYVGLTQKQIAQCLQCDQSFISKIENGDRPLSGAILEKAKSLFLCTDAQLANLGPLTRYYHTSLKSAQISNKSLRKLAAAQTIVANQYQLDHLAVPQDGASDITEPQVLQTSYNLLDAAAANSATQGTAENFLTPEQQLLLNNLHNLSSALKGKQFTPESIPLVAEQFRLLWNVDQLEPLDIFQVVLEKIPNLTIVCAELDPTVKGTCYQGETSHVIVINKNLTLAGQRHALAQQLFLLYCDGTEIKSLSTDYNATNATEQLAELFASYLLLPDASLSRFLYDNNAWASDADLLRLILQLEHTYQISHAAALARLGFLIDTKQVPADPNKLKTLAQQYGFDPSLYTPHTKVSNTNGYYLKKIDQLYQAGHINKKQMHQFLHTAQNFSNAA